MADEQKPDAQPDEESQAPAAVPTEDAEQIAGSAEDAGLAAAQQADAPGEQPQAAAEAEQPAAEAEQPAAEAEQPAAEAEQPAAEAEQPAAEAEQPPAGEPEGDQAESAPREKPAVPGAHLEVDIVPEGADPLGRGEGGEEYEDRYALDAETDEPAQSQEDAEEPITQPIATAAIDLASGARYRATGKRKTAIARVTLRPGTGTYLVNGRTLDQHFPRTTLQRNIRQPLETVGYEDRMDVVARLHGGGISAQAGALRHGVSRALLEADPNLRGELKRRGFLTRDSRAKERKKAGLKKARKRPQFSKR